MRNLPLLIALFLFGCSPEPAPKPVAAAPVDKAAQAPEAKVPSATDLFGKDGKADPSLPKTAGYAALAPKAGDAIAIITTDVGRIVIKFFPQKAPHHVKNFIDLANKHFYDGTKFHRVIAGFMIQGGDPNTKSPDQSKWGMGGPGPTVPAEFTDMPHLPGIVSMARSQDPDSAGSQFFIMHGSNPTLDGQYSVFGEVIEGMDVVNKIATAEKGPRDIPVKPVAMKVEITTWPIKLKG